MAVYVLTKEEIKVAWHDILITKYLHKRYPLMAKKGRLHDYMKLAQKDATPVTNITMIAD